MERDLEKCLSVRQVVETIFALDRDKRARGIIFLPENAPRLLLLRVSNGDRVPRWKTIYQSV